MDDDARERLLKLFDEVDTPEWDEDDPFEDDGEFVGEGDPDFVPNSDESEDESEKSDLDDQTVTEQDQIVTEQDQNFNDEEGEWEDQEDGSWCTDTKGITDFNFNSQEVGAHFKIERNSTPRQIFDEIFNDNIIEQLIVSTNEYGDKLVDTIGRKTRNSRFTSFKKTNKDELLKFIGLCLLAAQIKTPKIRDLFSNDPLNYHPIFPAVMTGRRFEQLLRCFSCNSNTENDGKLKKVDSFLKMIISSF